MAQKNYLLPALGIAALVGGVVYLVSGDAKAESEPTRRRTPTNGGALPSGGGGGGGGGTPKKGSGIAGISRAQMAKIQQMLTANGYDTKGIDGGYGPNTAKAISEFQEELGLAITGKPNEDTLLVLQGVEDERLEGGGTSDPVVDALVYNPGEWVTSLAPDQMARIELPSDFLEEGEYYSWSIIEPDLVGVQEHVIKGIPYLDIFPITESTGTATVLIAIIGPDDQPVFDEDMIIIVDLV